MIYTFQLGRKLLSNVLFFKYVYSESEHIPVHIYMAIYNIFFGKSISAKLANFPVILNNLNKGYGYPRLGLKLGLNQTKILWQHSLIVIPHTGINRQIGLRLELTLSNLYSE